VVPSKIESSIMMFSIKEHVKTFDYKVSKSTFGRVFRLDGSGHVSSSSRKLAHGIAEPSQPKERKGSKFLTEIRAGLTTFFTMAYIIAVNVSTGLLILKSPC
jgi:AGZA family xanthine/uracil permease-like MFS transporter